MISTDLPKITFGIILLNGEPFTRYCLRALYPFAHEIIVVEGACEAAASIATPEGHSTDGTLSALQDFKRSEDPDDKLQIVTKNSFWKEKDQQSQAYAERATGNYLWQVDIDEFYEPQQIQAVIDLLQNDPTISMISFRQITFWGGFDYVCDGWYLKRGAEIYNRIFRWGAGYRYVSHRPPQVVDQDSRDMRTINRVVLDELLQQRVVLYHYSLVFPKQVFEKCSYYQNASWANRTRAIDWAREVFLELKKPFRVHNVYDYPSWLEHYGGKHPPQIENLRKDLQSGELKIEIRTTEDIEALLSSRSYRAGRILLKLWEPFDRIVMPILRRLYGAIRHPVRAFGSLKRKSAYWAKQLF